MSSENDELENKPQPTEETEGPEKTVAIGGGDQPEPEKKKEKKPGDWVTAQMSKAKRPETPPATAGDEWASAGAKPSATPSGPEKAPASFTPPPAVSEAATSAQSGLNKLLSDIGIKDPNTQKTVLIVGGVALVLIACCACACIVAIITGNLQLF